MIYAGAAIRTRLTMDGNPTGQYAELRIEGPAGGWQAFSSGR
jgi:hypothetical protein